MDIRNGGRLICASGEYLVHQLFELGQGIRVREAGLDHLLGAECFGLFLIISG